MAEGEPGHGRRDARADEDDADRAEARRALARHHHRQPGEGDAGEQDRQLVGPRRLAYGEQRREGRQQRHHDGDGVDQALPHPPRPAEREAHEQRPSTVALENDDGGHQGDGDQGLVVAKRLRHPSGGVGDAVDAGADKAEDSAAEKRHRHCTPYPPADDSGGPDGEGHDHEAGTVAARDVVGLVDLQFEARDGEECGECREDRQAGPPQ
jgi:hypothetical protein